MQTDRVVPVIRFVNGSRRVGSGYRVADCYVLTAAHCVTGTGLQVWLPDGKRAATVVANGVPDVDLALLQITPGPGQPPVAGVPPTRCGRVDRLIPGRIGDCVSVGYPRWATLPDAPFTTGELDGWIPAGSGLTDTQAGRTEGFLTLMALGSPPRPLPTTETGLSQSQWSGMSGAAVFAGGLLVGVVAEHHLPAGDGSLTVVPVEWADRVRDGHEHLFRALAVTSAEQLTTVTAARLPERPLAPGTIPVQRAAKDPRSIFLSVGIDTFTGRDWLARQVDEFMVGHTCGYIFVEAVAGMGKTAFAASLVKNRGYLSHFSRYAEGRKQQEALKNLSAQLIRDYALDDQAPGGLLPTWAQTPSGFEELLTLAADRAVCRGTPLVIVVDGLDEAEPSETGLPFGLPGALPEPVYVVATFRTGLTLTAPVAPVTYLHIDEDSRENQADIGDFLSRAVQQEPLAGRLAEAGLEPASVVRLLAERSGGVWVYLRYVLEELRTGTRQPGEMWDLPSGLQDYYASQVRRWQQDPGWPDGLLPLVATLGAAGEPLPVAALARLAGKLPAATVRHWCEFTLRPLLTMTRAATPKAPLEYEIYHASFREVIRGDLERSDLAALAEELAEATATAHVRIAQTYLAEFGGLDAGLPTLVNELDLAEMDGGYPLRQLARHLEQAELASSLHALLAAEQPTAGQRAVNVWSAAHDHADSLGRYLNDVDRARLDSARRTDAALLDRRLPGSLGHEIRYALVAASIASRTANIPDALLELAFQAGVWSPRRGLDHARRLTDLSRRVAALSLIARYCGEAERLQILAEALAAARTADGPAQAAALAALAPNLPAELLPGALDAALAIGGAPDQAQAIASLAPYLPADLLDRALAAADDLTTDSALAQALTGLVPFLPAGRRPAVLSRALRAATAVPDEKLRAALLTGLAPHLPGDLLGDALDGVGGLGDVFRGQALAAMAEYLPPDLLARALAVAGTITYDSSAGWALSGLAPHLTADLLGPALAAVGGISEEYTRSRALASLAPRLPPVLLTRALATAERFTTGASRAQALTGLVPYLPADQQRAAFDQALAAAVEISEGVSRNLALAELAPYLPPDLQARAVAAVTPATDEQSRRALVRMAPHLPPDLLARALEAITEARHEAGGPYFGSLDDISRGEVLAGFAPYLTPQLLARALDAARALTVDRARAESLIGLAAYLPADLFSSALAAVAAITSDGWRARALAGLAPHLPPGPLAQALAEALAIGDDRARSEALTGLAPHLPPAQQVSMLTQALDAATAIADDYDRAGALTGLAPHIPAARRPEVLAAALDAALLGVDLLAAGALTDLVPQLPGELLSRVLEAASTLASGSARAQVLTVLAPRLPPGLLPRAVQVVAATADEGGRAWALGSLVPYLPASLLGPALDVATGIADSSSLRRALVALAPRLPPDLLARALAATASITDVGHRVEALAELAPHLPPAQQASVLAQALGDAASADGEHRAQALVALAPHLPADLLPRAVDAAAVLADQDARARALVGLAEYLPPDLVTRALGVAMAITGDEARARALIGVAPRVPADTRPAVLTRALAILETRDGYLTWQLTRLAPHLPAELVPRALAAVCAITADTDRMRALAGLAPRLTPELVPRALDAVARSAGSPRSQALVSLVPRLPAELLSSVVDIAVTISDPGSPVDVLVALAPRMPEDLLARALDLAAAMTSAADRAILLAGLAPHLPAGLLSRALLLAPKDRDGVFTAILDRGFTILPARDWVEHLRYSLAGRHRFTCLKIIASAAPAIAAVGGPEAAAGCADAIIDVHRWWP